ncbi:MAG: hypothetical protein GX638_00280 [Crenarchaeota archaeon]|nr:hypothetical protein [Thermoproteota archaeon]
MGLFDFLFKKKIICPYCGGKCLDLPDKSDVFDPLKKLLLGKSYMCQKCGKIFNLRD